MDNESGSPVFYAKSDDPEMEKAMASAAASFKYLWRELTWDYRRIVSALELSAIKAAFNDPDGAPDMAEHMWLSDIEFDGDVIEGTLMNSPNALTSYEEGDTVTLRTDQIEDWMYVIDGHVYGGFTLQHLRAGMSTSERQMHDQAWGFEFAEPSRVDVVPNWQAKKNKKSGNQSGQSVPPAGDPDAEHPMSENMAKGLADAIEENREQFLEVGSEGLSTLHSLALGGSAACVRVLLEAGADPTTKTTKGKTARELAEMMGWPRVVAILREAETAG